MKNSTTLVIFCYYFCFLIHKWQPKFRPAGSIVPPSCPYSLHGYSGRLGARSTSAKKPPLNALFRVGPKTDRIKGRNKKGLKNSHLKAERVNSGNEKRVKGSHLKGTVGWNDRVKIRSEEGLKHSHQEGRATWS
jgi:hypothetical protein